MDPNRGEGRKRGREVLVEGKRLVRGRETGALNLSLETRGGGVN